MHVMRIARRRRKVANAAAAAGRSHRTASYEGRESLCRQRALRATSNEGNFETTTNKDKYVEEMSKRIQHAA